VAYKKIQQWALVNMGFIEGEEFIEEMSDYHVLKNCVLHRVCSVIQVVIVFPSLSCSLS
jgi:hypothetical protein